jgi:hypothetical protein
VAGFRKEIELVPFATLALKQKNLVEKFPIHEGQLATPVLTQEAQGDIQHRHPMKFDDLHPACRTLPKPSDGLGPDLSG